MTPAEATQLLALASTFDNRKPDRLAPAAWAEALHDICATDARAAVIGHYRESRQWIMPADIYKRVQEIRGKRLGAAPPFARQFDHDPYRFDDVDDTNLRSHIWWRAEARYKTLVGDGGEPAACYAQAVEEVRAWAERQIEAAA